jgi:hypothetical protein
MKSKTRYLFLSLLIALVSGGCGRTAQVVPTIDSSARETALAGTALAFGTATPSPAPTETLVPTTVVSSYGTSVTKRADGSTLFADQRAGVQITFPDDWLAMRVGEPEYYQAWEGEASRNPALLIAITSIQNLDLNLFRISAFDMNADHLLYESLPGVRVVFIQNDSRTLRQVEADERRRIKILKDYKYLPSELQTTANGFDVLMIQYQWQATNSAKQSFTGYYKGFLFKIPTGNLAVEMSVPLDVKEPLEEGLKQIVDSVTTLSP